MAFRRLMAEAARGGQVKVDAIVALSQRTVLVPTFEAGGEEPRTLTNTGGEAALPVFSDLEQLELAAARFGWLNPNGRAHYREIGARQALRFVLDRDLSFLVVDIVSHHALEVKRGEIEPLLGSDSRASSSGPFAAVGRISSTMLERVQPTAPSSHPSLTEAGEPRYDSTPPPPMSPPAALAEATGSLLRSGEFELLPLGVEPEGAFLDGLAGVLRSYPEVEWAAWCRARTPELASRGAIGLRVDISFRDRIEAIAKELLEQARELGLDPFVFLIDDPAMMRVVRHDELVFFPWRRKPS